jgi:hypothetical protein
MSRGLLTDFGIATWLHDLDIFSARRHPVPAVLMLRVYWAFGAHFNIGRHYRSYRRGAERAPRPESDGNGGKLWQIRPVTIVPHNPTSFDLVVPCVGQKPTPE